MLLLVVGQTAVVGQDCWLYPGQWWNGTPTALHIGETLTVSNCDLCATSVAVREPDAAIQVSLANPPSGYPRMFYYSEVSQPVLDTDQYDDRDLVLSCGAAGSRPQPDTFVPIDHATVNEDRRASIKIPRAGHPVLALRRAYFWENSEDLVFPHGPVGNLKIRVTDPAVVSIPYEDLLRDKSLYQSLTWGDLIVIPGPVYLDDILGPNPQSEWLDGTWGAVYSNVGLVDWDADCDEDPAKCVDARGLVVVEGDNDASAEDPLGVLLVTRSSTRTIHGVRAFGWLELENVQTGPEPNVASANLYVYDDWDGAYPISIDGHYCCDQQSELGDPCSRCSFTYGPSTCGDRLDCSLVFSAPCVSICGMYEGSPYRPYSDWDKAYLEALPGASIGLLKGRYPGGRILEKPMTLYAFGGSAVWDK